MELIDDDEDVRILGSSKEEVVTRSDEIAIGVSPNTFSTNHLCGFEISLVDWSDSATSENPSDESSFCSLAKKIRETTAARRPVGQSIKTAKMNGITKKRTEPNVLSKNSMEFRGAISAKDPATMRPITDRIVEGQCKTACEFVTQDIRLISISSMADAFGEATGLGLGEATGEATGEAILIVVC